MEVAPYHLGFTTLSHETGVHRPAVEGSFPEWLCGALLRAGPAQFEVGAQQYRHWFDGLAMLHSFQFANGSVSYANRFLRSRAYLDAVNSGRISYPEFATDPCKTLFQRVTSHFTSRISDNGCVNVNRIAGQYLAQGEQRLAARFDPRTLETLGVFDLETRSGDPLPGPVSTPHPHYDAARRSSYNYVVDFGLDKSVYRIFAIDASTGRQKLIAAIPAKRPSYMHSFAITRRYIVLAEFPFVANPLALKYAGRPFIENYRWRPQRGTCFSVIDKQTGNVVRQAQGEAVFAFHHINAFESNGKVLIDMVAHPDADVVEQLYLHRLRSPEASAVSGTPIRCMIELDGYADATVRSMTDVQIELPRINYQRQSGRPYRYLFAVGDSGKHDFFDTLCKLDISKGSHAVWQETGCYPGEPVFVPHPNAYREDDGVALSVVLDAARERSFLLCMDANTWQERARAYVPHHIPFGFHGNYFKEIHATH